VSPSYVEERREYDVLTNGRYPHSEHGGSAACLDSRGLILAPPAPSTVLKISTDIRTTSAVAHPSTAREAPELLQRDSLLGPNIWPSSKASYRDIGSPTPSSLAPGGLALPHSEAAALGAISSFSPAQEAFDEGSACHFDTPALV
jgi:hypothetical protein